MSCFAYYSTLIKNIAQLIIHFVLYIVIFFLKFACFSFTESYLFCSVVDLGVMTPSDKIIKRAMEEKAGLVSLLAYNMARVTLAV